MIKILSWSAGAIGAFVILFIGAFFLASERGEVVVLKTDLSETRLWVVDYKGYQWLRRGDGVTAWASELGDEVEVTRNGKSISYRPIIVTAGEDRDTINELTLQKYGLSERYLRLLGLNPEEAAAIRLEPL